jgi:hypothetical protein
MNRIDYLKLVTKPLEVHKLNQARHNKIRRLKVRSWLLSQKNKPCVDCGKQLESNLMEFDHITPKQKLFNIAKSISSFGMTKLALEVSKCTIRCKPCHTLRTQNQIKEGLIKVC